MSNTKTGESIKDIIDDYTIRRAVCSVGSPMLGECFKYLLRELHWINEGSIIRVNSSVRAFRVWANYCNYDNPWAPLGDMCVDVLNRLPKEVLDGVD